MFNYDDYVIDNYKQILNDKTRDDKLVLLPINN